MYSIYEQLRDSKGYKDSDVARATGINPTVFSEWKKGKSAPKVDKLILIANFFEVSIDYLLGLEQSREWRKYYLDDDTAKEAQDMFDDPDMRALFHMKQNMDPQRFAAHKKMMQDMYKLEHPEDNYDFGD